MIFVIYVFVFTFAFSSAILEEKTYYLGDSIKMDLSNYSNYSLNIQAPTFNVSFNGEGKIFLFDLNETGVYHFEFFLDGNFEEYYLDVLNVNSSEYSEIDEISNSDNFVQKVIAGEPVKNVERVYSNDSDVSFNIPTLAENISVYENGENASFEIEETIYNKVISIVSAGNAEKEIVVNDLNSNDEIVLEYYTPAPEKKEKELNELKKEVEVSSELHYENVWTTTNVSEIYSIDEKNLIQVYWKEEGTYLDFQVFDNDNNGLIDEIGWTVPHLSTQTFEISFVILNVQSYPKLNGIWEVQFNTTGKANLTIRAIEETTWSLSGENSDLKFLDLKCGDKSVNYEWINDSIFVENYECNEIGSEMSSPLTLGKHVLEFDFGGIKELAYNSAGTKKLYLSSTATSGACPSTSRVFSETSPSRVITTWPGYFTSSTPGNTDAGQWLPNNANRGNTTVSIEIANSSQTSRNSASFGQGWLFYENLTGYTLYAGNFSMNLSIFSGAGTTSLSNRYTVRLSIVNCSGGNFNLVQNLTNTRITGESSNTVGQTHWYDSPARITQAASGSRKNISFNVYNNINYTFDSGEYLFIEFGFNDASSTTSRALGLDYNFSNTFVTTPYIADITPPLVNLTNPDDQINSSSSLQNLTCNVSDTNALKNITFYIWNSTSLINKTVNLSGTVNSSIYSIDLSDGEYKWACDVFDAEGNSNTSSNQSFTVDTTKPLIQFENPTAENYANKSQNWIFANVSVIEENEKNITFNLYNSSALINSTTFTTKQRTINWTGLSDGKYYYNVTALDFVENENSTETREINLDVTKPLVKLNNPLNESSTVNSTVEFNFTAQDNIDTNLTCNLTVDNVVIFSNFGIQNNTNSLRAFSDFSLGIHFWNVTCIDDFGNENFSETNNFVLADIPLVYLLTSNNSYFSTGNVNLTYNISDNDGIFKTYLILNGVLNKSNQSIILNNQINNFSFVSPDERDSSMRTCTAVWGFDCGAGPPESGDNTYDSCSTGTGADESVEQIYLNATSVYAGNTVNVTCTFDPYTSSDYSYIWYYNGTGWKNLYNHSNWGSSSLVNESVVFIVDDVEGTQYVRCGINYDQSTDVDECQNSGSYYDNDDLNFTVLAKSSGGLGLTDGVYNWSVNASDYSDLEGAGNETRIFYIDTKKPMINLNYPSNGASIQNDTITFNFTAQDNMDTNMTCNLTLDNVVRFSNIGALNNTEVSRTLSSLSTGIHFWNVTCVDNALNVNTSITRNFTVADLPPVIYLITPNNTYSSTGSINLTYNVTDNDGISRTYLILNGVLNRSNQSTVVMNEFNNFTLTGLSDGIYSWTVNATDTGGYNSTNSSARNFIVDTKKPMINLNLPSNATTYNFSSINFNFTAIDNLDSSLICNLSVGEKVDLNFVAQNNTLINRLMSNLTDGDKVWNVTCSDDAGNINTSINRIVSIREYPKIVLNTANNTNFNSTLISLLYTPSDNTNLSWCGLYLNGVLNQTNQTAIKNGVQNNFTFTLSEGTYDWYVSCNDTINLNNVSETRRFLLDVGGLNVTVFSPESGTSFFTNVINFSYMATDNSDSLLDCKITVNGQVLDNYSASNGTTVNRSITFSTGGTKFWNVTCLDDSGNSKVSELRNFTLAFAPTLSLFFPENLTWFNSSEINFTYYISDPNNNLKESTFILNGTKNITNQSEILNNDYNNFTLTLGDGVYNWSVNATDTTDLEGKSNETRIFYVDTKSPQITLNSPSQGQNLNWNNITFNFTVKDNIDANVSCDLNIDGVSERENLAVNNGTPTLIYISKSDGNYSWDLICRDHANNVNTSDSVNFSIEAPPRISLLSPSINSRFNVTSVTFTYLPEDAFGLYNCSIYLDSSFNNSNAVILANQNNSFTINGISEGVHNWSVECYDAFPDFNLGVSNISNFTIDKTAPAIFLISPQNNSGIDRNKASVSFSWTPVDTLDDALQCNLYVDSVKRRSNLWIQSNFTQTESISGLSEGWHNWSTECWDQVKNTNVSQTYFFNYVYPDFSVNQISFNNTNVVEGDVVLVNATVKNSGLSDTTNVSVSFYKGNISSQTKFFESYINLTANETKYLTSNFNTTIGLNSIYVAIDYANKFNETNESNNILSNNLSVGAWHFFYGDILVGTNYSLASSSGDLIDWRADNFENGSIFVSDKESSISWNNLYPLGKAKDNTERLNDFSEIDTLLSMTNFSDSISNLYLNAGNVTSSDNYLIFNKMVQNVPIANSTNNSNFMTGILWDGSDDTDNQFDSTQKEDLVFVTKVNKDGVGKFGNYDYELRVPAKLRQYSGTNSEVVFYVEIY